MSESESGTAIDSPGLEFIGRVAKIELRALTRLEPETRQADDPSLLPESLPPFERVNVTLRCDGRIRGSMSASGQTLAEQIRNAIRKASLDRRFNGPLSRKELLRTSVEVWIQTASIDLDVSERTGSGCLVLGLHGAEVHCDGRGAYYKPSVAITSGMRSTHRLLDALCRKAKLPKNSWRDERTVVKRTSWICVFVEEAGAPRVLRYLRTTPSDEVSAQMMAKWVSDSCAYFGNHQAWTGAIPYVFNPVREEVLPTRMNIVRAAGCLYSLSQAVDADASPSRPDDRLTTLRLAKFLIGHTRIWQDRCRVVEDEALERYPKVGATALMLAALSFPTLKSEFGAVEMELRESIHRSQKPNGRFLTHFGREEEGTRQIEFYPGQVLVALALQVHGRSSTSAQICAAAFEPYRRHFTASPTSAFVGWHIDAWSRLAISLGRDDYALFAYQQADWLLERQITDPAMEDDVGGFAKDNQRPAFSSIVFVEALTSALKLAAARNDRGRCGRYSAAIRLGLSFCQRLQLSNIPAAFFPNPEKCIGGIAMRHEDLNVRCDVVQHFLTMALATYANHHLIYG